MPDPYRLLSSHADITLLRRPLPPGEMGRWYPAQRVIVLDSHLTQAEERCTLMHELVHALHDEFGIDDPWLAGRQERACHEFVARVLIPVHRLVEEAVHADDYYCLAEALNVDLDTLQVRIDHLHPSERGQIGRALSMKEHTA